MNSIAFSGLEALVAFFKARGVILLLIGVLRQASGQRHVYLLSLVALSVLFAIGQADSVQNMITRPEIVSW